MQKNDLEPAYFRKIQGCDWPEMLVVNNFEGFQAKKRKTKGKEMRDAIGERPSKKSSGDERLTPPELLQALGQFDLDPGVLLERVKGCA